MLNGGTYAILKTIDNRYRIVAVRTIAMTSSIVAIIVSLMPPTASTLPVLTDILLVIVIMGSR